MLPRWWSAAALAATVCTASKSFLPSSLSSNDVGNRSYSPDFQPLEEVLEALAVMQDEYFQPWLGEWPSAIDWTAAVMGSHVSGALATLSKSLELVQLEGNEDYKLKENIITLYFSQLVSSYFGQNALSLRHQAFDDMLWVVLGWLDTTQFIELRTTSYLQKEASAAGLGGEIPAILQNQTWHGNVWVPAFAHRARIFWELASKGWDNVLCRGGMTWNPRLEPYKNAITNELFIAASINMHLYFPGDTNTSPYTPGSDFGRAEPDPSGETYGKPHGSRYLYAAVNGYEWLMNSGMTNAQGLFIDGFHISGLHNKSNPNTKCDVRNEMVYTYNQGVILTAQIGLFKISGNLPYLDDGHKLIQNVIAATGYDLTKDRPADDLSKLRPEQLPRWRGLGRAGVLEDFCDRRGDCSQNGHTFKGIFFHHLTTFCAPLGPLSDLSSSPMDEHEFAQIKGAHDSACAAYLGWVRHNARAALLTRDTKGRFGTWWTAGLLGLASSVVVGGDDDAETRRDGAVDYRNYGVPDDDPLWVPEGSWGPPSSSPVVPGSPLGEPGLDQRPLGGPAEQTHFGRASSPITSRGEAAGSDPNNRGRGRTVETQGGGLAVLRCLWEISRLNSAS